MTFAPQCLYDRISIFVFHIKLFWDHSSNGFSYFQSTNADVHHPFYIIIDTFPMYTYIYIWYIFSIYMHAQDDRKWRVQILRCNRPGNSMNWIECKFLYEMRKKISSLFYHLECDHKIWSENKFIWKVKKNVEYNKR